MANILEKLAKAALFGALATVPFVALGMADRQPGWWVCGREVSPEVITVACLGPRPDAVALGALDYAAPLDAVAAGRAPLTFVLDEAVPPFPLGRLIVRSAS